MSELELQQSGWWQASDGNWYPPQTATVDFGSLPPVERRPSWFAAHRRLLGAVAVIVVIAGLGATALSFRSSANKWKAREHEQHARADGLQADLTSTSDQLRSVKNDLDVANSNLTDVQSWSKQADAALSDYGQCVDDLNVLFTDILDMLISGRVNPGIDAESRRVDRECTDAQTNGDDLAGPPTGTT